MNSNFLKNNDAYSELNEKIILLGIRSNTEMDFSSDAFKLLRINYLV